MATGRSNAELRRRIDAAEDKILRLRMDIDNDTKSAEKLINPARRTPSETFDESLRRLLEGMSDGYTPGDGARDVLHRYREKRFLEEEHIPQLKRHLKQLQGEVGKMRDELYRRDRPDLFPSPEARQSMEETAPGTSPGPEGPIIRVQKGDTLRKLAARYLGQESLWPQIYDIPQNRDVIGNDPDLIHPGQQLVLPEGSEPLCGPGSAKDRGQIDTSAMSALDLARHYVSAGATPPDPTATQDMETLRQASLDLARQTSGKIAAAVADNVAGQDQWADVHRYADAMAAQIAADAVYAARIQAEGPDAWKQEPELDAARLAAVESASVAALEPAERAQEQRHWNEIEKQTYQKVHDAAQREALAAIEGFHAPDIWTAPASLGEQALQKVLDDIGQGRFDHIGLPPIGAAAGFGKEIGPGSPEDRVHFGIPGDTPQGQDQIPLPLEVAPPDMDRLQQIGQSPALRGFAQHLHSTAHDITQKRAHSAGLHAMAPQVDSALQGNFTQMHSAAHGAALPHFDAPGKARR